MIEVTVCGIPAQARITYYTPAEPPVHGWGNSRPYAGCEADFEFDLLDRKGYPAAWLENKMMNTSGEYERVCRQIGDEL